MGNYNKRKKKIDYSIKMGDITFYDLDREDIND